MAVGPPEGDGQLESEANTKGNRAKTERSSPDAAASVPESTSA